MAYQILGFSTSPITQETVYSILCDTVNDLPVGTISGNGYSGNITQGCSAKIVENGASYIANSSGQWILQPSGQMWVNVYTKSEVDTLISGYQPLLTFGEMTVKDSADSLKSGAIWSSVWDQIFGLNSVKNLAAGDDLNDFTTPGIYRCTNSATAQQLLNMPSPNAQQAGGRLIVSIIGGTGRYFQFYVSSGARFWLRSNTSSGWLPWYEYAGTQVSNQLD